MSSISQSIADTILVLATVIVVAAVALLVISIISLNAQAKNVTALVEINKQSVFERAYLNDGRDNVHDAWFTINDERIRNGSYYDMADWIWADDGFNDSPLNATLVLPTPEREDEWMKICFEDDWEYKSCKSFEADGVPSTIHFFYPR